MPSYKNIDAATVDGKWTAERLLALRGQLQLEIPPKTANDTLLLASWNIREFDSAAYGERIPESFHYIAEIVSHFDLIAVQEVRKDLQAWRRLLDLLGERWKYVVTDVTEGKHGNNERLAFLYDSGKVQFGGLAGELVVPAVKRAGKVYQPAMQLARTPFICGFQVGWSRFLLATVHIVYGKSKADDPARVEEIRQLAQFLKKRTEDETAWARNLILLGDFNIFRPADTTFKQLTDAGFVIPPELSDLPSNASRNKYYDQIAFRISEDRLDTTGKAGVFDFYQSVFRDNEVDCNHYIAPMGEAYFRTSRGSVRSASSQRRYYKTYWRTHQMSDHLPLWVELKIDYSDRFLQRILEP